MLKSFYFKNYKAFSKKTEIDISDINILLWKNSIWKSSVLEVLLLILQTLEVWNIDSTNKPLVLNWKILKLWNKNEFVYSNESTNPTKFEFGFVFDWEAFNDYILEKYELFETIIKHLISNNFNNLENENIDRKDYFIKKFKEISDIDFLNIKKISTIKRVISSFIREIEKNDKLKSRFELEVLRELVEYSDTIKFFLWIIIEGKEKNDIEIQLSFTINRNIFFINKYIFKYWKKKVFKILNRNWQYAFDISSSEIFKKNKLWFTSIFPFLNNNNRKKLLQYWHFLWNDLLLQWMFSLIKDEFKSVFKRDKLYHIWPLRANPKRHYLMDEFYDFSSDIWESTVQELNKKDVQEFANKWFKEFWLEVDSNWKWNSVLKSLKVKQNWWIRDIVDVWFWISQILPIIVQTMIVPEWSIVLIEQPEIHLHPSMQSKLADLFIEIINKRKINLIIETHSEYFLNRLKLRLIQTKNDSNDIEKIEKITNDKINIYFFQEDKEKKWTDVQKVKIHDFWKIDFPKWFKEDEIDDSFLYMQELLKNNFN